MQQEDQRTNNKEELQQEDQRTNNKEELQQEDQRTNNKEELQQEAIQDEPINKASRKRTKRSLHTKRINYFLRFLV